jgi:hypothetical protein
MPSYRGVKKEVLVDSVDRAIAFIDRLDLGPLTGQMLEKLVGQDKLTEIAYAETDAELAYAVQDTNIGVALTLFSRVLKFHALTDPAPAGGKSEALDIYSKLISWGAFPPGEFQVTSGMDTEFNAHLVPAYIKTLTNEDMAPGSDAQKLFKGLLDNFRRMEAHVTGNAAIAKWLEESIPLIVDLTKMGAGKTEIGQIMEGNPLGAALVPRTLEIMLNLKKREEALQIEGAVDQYRVALGKVPEDEDEIKAIFQPILDEIQSVMQPYLRKDEMIPRMMTYVDPEKSEGHIFIYATREAAQFLAFNLPEDIDLFDSRDRRVEGRLPPPPQAGSSPSAPTPNF